ncbi:hypothetical protein [Bradyrhizobium jicamae]|nr:hypothetical protein [Bradyrhizobium jicamae]
MPRRTIGIEPLNGEYEVLLLHCPKCKSLVRLASRKERPARHSG